MRTISISNFGDFFSYLGQLFLKTSGNFEIHGSQTLSLIKCFEILDKQERIWLGNAYKFALELLFYLIISHLLLVVSCWVDWVLALSFVYFTLFLVLACCCCFASSLSSISVVNRVVLAFVLPEVSQQIVAKEWRERIWRNGSHEWDFENLVLRCQLFAIFIFLFVTYFRLLFHCVSIIKERLGSGNSFWKLGRFTK